MHSLYSYTGTHHLKNATVSQTLDRKICFHCSIVSASHASGCFVTVTNDTWNYTITILRSCYTCLNNTECISVEKISDGYYNASYNAIDLDGLVLENGKLVRAFLLMEDERVLETPTASEYMVQISTRHNSSAFIASEAGIDIPCTQTIIGKILINCELNCTV